MPSKELKSEKPICQILTGLRGPVLEDNFSDVETGVSKLKTALEEAGSPKDSSVSEQALDLAQILMAAVRGTSDYSLKSIPLRSNVAFNLIAAQTHADNNPDVERKIVSSCLFAGNEASACMMAKPKVEMYKDSALMLFGLLADNPYRLSIPESVRAYAQQMKEGLQRGDVRSVYNPRLKV